jgi:hypothetical protein
MKPWQGQSGPRSGHLTTKQIPPGWGWSQDHRKLLNGIVWVLRTGAPWRRSGSPQRVVTNGHGSPVEALPVAPPGSKAHSDLT